MDRNTMANKITAFLQVDVVPQWYVSVCRALQLGSGCSDKKKCTSVRLLGSITTANKKCPFAHEDVVP
jgi:hypothetical protein